MSEEADVPARTGSYVDLARRVDRVEQNVANLSGTVARVELNQQHAEELTKLRFDALDTGLKSVGGQLADFMRRIEGIITGEVETVQSRQGQEIIADYQRWRASVDTQLEAAGVLAGQLRLLGRVALVLLSGNALALVAAIAALLK